MSETYSTGDVVVATGVSPERIRQWRFQGHLRRPDGSTIEGRRFGRREIYIVGLIAALSDLGVDPNDSWPLLNSVALTGPWWTIRDPAAPAVMAIYRQDGRWRAAKHGGAGEALQQLGIRLRGSAGLVLLNVTIVLTEIDRRLAELGASND